MVANLARSQAETDRQLKAFQAKTDRLAEDNDRRAEADRQLMRDWQARAERKTQELKTQLDGLSNKFGFFTEGLLLPSVETMLRKHYGITDFYTRLKSKHGAETLELDGFGFVNGKKNIGFVIEVKSRLEKRSIKQTQELMEKFRKFHPQYGGMTLYGIIAAVDAISDTVRKEVFAAGLYLVTVHDDIVNMPKPPKGFTPFAVKV